jgi:cysteine desulfurase
MAADLEGLCLASGTACASGSATPAPALVAMGLPAAVALGAVRISLGRTTTEDDVTEAVDRLGRVFRRLRA